MGGQLTQQIASGPAALSKSMISGGGGIGKSGSNLITEGRIDAAKARKKPYEDKNDVLGARIIAQKSLIEDKKRSGTLTSADISNLEALESEKYNNDLNIAAEDAQIEKLKAKKLT